MSVKLMNLLDLQALSIAVAPEELVTTSLWRNWTDRIDAQALARPVEELAEKAQVNLSSGDWRLLADYTSEFPFSALSKEDRRALILLVATLAEDCAVGTPHQPVDARYMEQLTCYGDPGELVSEGTWSGWCKALKASKLNSRLVAEIAGGLGLSWPYTRRFEAIERYLDLTLGELRAMPSIGRKKLRTIILCIAQAVYELRPASTQGERVASRRSTREVIEESLNRLRENSREVIELRFGLRGDTPQTLADIAEKHDLTRERIRQLEVKALETLRTSARLSPQLLRNLNDEADVVWAELVTGDEVILSDIPEKELAGRLNPTYRLSFVICELPVSSFLDGIAVRVAGGWYRSAVDRFLVERVIFELEHGAGAPFPAPTEVVARRMETTIPAVRLAAAFSSTTTVYKDYIWNGRLGEPGRRSIVLHRLLASMNDRVAVDTAELVSIHNGTRPYAPCSYRDAEMAMTRFGHLFLQMGKGAWTVAGGVPIASISEVDPEDTLLVDEPDQEDIAAEIDSNTAAGAIAVILTEFGPLRMSQVVDHFRVRTDFQPASVGPILLTRSDFLRMAPGVYGLPQHLGDKSAREKARRLLLKDAACAEFIRAVRAGEPRNRFPLWNPRMEHDWCEWARNDANSDIYTSLLTVVEPNRWEQTSVEERNRWQRLKRTDSCYKIDRELNVVLPESLLLKDLLGPIVAASRQDQIGWVTINHLNGNRQNDGKGLVYLGILIAAGVLHAQEDWRLPHAASDEAGEICNGLLETLHLDGQLRWDSTIGELLKDRIGKRLTRTQGWIAAEIAESLRSLILDAERKRHFAAEAVTQAIVELGIAIASADGEPDVLELKRVRNHALMSLTELGGPTSGDPVSLVEGFMKRALDATPDPITISKALRDRMSSDERKNLMTHLFMLAAEDGVFHESEGRLLVLLQKRLDIDPDHFEALYRTHARDPRAASFLSEKLRTLDSQESAEDLVSLLTL